MTSSPAAGATDSAESPMVCPHCGTDHYDESDGTTTPCVASIIGSALAVPVVYRNEDEGPR